MENINTVLAQMPNLDISVSGTRGEHLPLLSISMGLDQSQLNASSGSTLT